jgi:hypothetical protein
MSAIERPIFQTFVGVQLHKNPNTPDVSARNAKPIAGKKRYYFLTVLFAPYNVGCLCNKTSKIPDISATSNGIVCWNSNE